MRVRAASIGTGLIFSAILVFVSGCSGASFSERMAYLTKVANEGAQTHRLIIGEGGSTDRKRCTDAFNGLNDWDSAPSDDGMGGRSGDWLNQIQAFFVQSCVTGLPKAVPGAPTASSS